jgi:Co/Zn/Cd efflux system component
MKLSTFHLARMDCSSEEQLVRMKLGDLAEIRSLSFDLPNRTLRVHHDGDPAPIAQALDELNLQSRLVETTEADAAGVPDSDAQQRSLLFTVLAINAVLFLVEIVAGFLADSMGLIADSLDMLADAIVYSLSLFAVGAAVARKKRIAKVSGYFQLGLAVFGFVEVVRRFLGFGESPEFRAMILVSLLALAGNLASIVLLRRSRSEDAHMKASMIFTSNDVLANLGVILAGALVYLTASRIPDLVVGSLIFVLVARGAVRILRLAK